MEFKPEEKINAFDKIAELYFSKNFGSMSKADLETLLFSEYLEHCMREGIAFDDYTLSKELGITQSRIRSLKERKELKYPYYKECDWKSAFAESIKNAKYDENDHYVKFIIQEVYVLEEVRHYIEEKGWFDECSLNKKLLRIPLDCFVDICVEDTNLSDLFSDEAAKKVKKISRSENEIIQFTHNFTKEGLKQFLMSAGKEALLSVLPCLPFGGVAKTAFDFLERVIKGV